MYGKEGIGMPEVMNLPTKIYLEEYDGNVIKYFEAVYSIFKNDFVDNKPNFRGIRLGLKKYPLILDKEYTFYHMTHEGDIETERTPDFRRMERIRFPKIMIDKSTHPYLKVWRNQRTGTGGTKNRILIYHEEENYLVVLADMGSYILPWTAYPITYNNVKRKLLKEYNEFIRNAEAV